MIEDSGVWFQQTFNELDDDISAMALESRALEHKDSHDFFPPPLHISAGVRSGYQRGLSIPCRWVEAWDPIKSIVFVRFDIMGKLKPGAFFAKFVNNLTSYTAGIDGPGIRIYFSTLHCMDVSLKDWLEGDYEWA